MATEELKSAETSLDATGAENEVAEQNGVADAVEQESEPEADETNDAEFKDGGDEAKADEPTESPKKEPQSRERNAEEARKRREAEKQKAIQTARVEAVLEATGGVNPYTGNAMTDADDVDEYLTMKRIEKDGKDPLADYSEWVKQQARKQKQEAQAREKAQAKARDDMDAFRRAYPDVNIQQLLGDESFSDYADGKLGNKPLTEIYEKYQKLVGNTRVTEQEKAAQALANSRATPGSASSTATPKTDFFTHEQVAKMSVQEVLANYDTIMKSKEKW